MEFAFITDVTTISVLDVLVKIYNLGLTSLYFAIMYVGYKVIIRVFRKGVLKWQN